VVDGFFATLTKRRLKRGVFRSVADLQAAINRFLAEHNQQSQPFTWTADPVERFAYPVRHPLARRDEMSGDPAPLRPGEHCI